MTDTRSQSDPRSNTTSKHGASSDSLVRASEQEVQRLFKELMEARKLAIKTDNLVKNLGAEIKQVSRNQDAYQRRQLFTSAVAYVVFAAVTFAGLYMAFDAKISAANSEVEHFTVRNTFLELRLDDIQTELEHRREGEHRAYAFYELIQNGSYDEVVEQFQELQAQLSDRTMIELLRNEVDEINYDLAEQAFRGGVRHYQADNWSDARDAFLRSLNYLERAPWAPELHYYVGSSLFHLEDFQGAMAYFDLAVSSEELSDTIQPMARYRIGLALQNIDRLPEAIEALRQYRSLHPNHRYAGRALNLVNRMERALSRVNND